MGESVTYRIEHETRYEYRVHGRDIAARRVSAAARTAVSARAGALPDDRARSPSSLAERRDYFGNVVDHVTLLRPHDALTVTSRSIVRVSNPVNWQTPTPACRGKRSVTV